MAPIFKSLSALLSRSKKPIHPTSPKSHPMKIVLVDESTLAKKDLTPALLTRISGALSRQLNESYATFCQSQGCPVGIAANLASVPKDEDVCVMAILDSADQAGALGYHDTTPDGRPYGKVFLEPILSNGGDLITQSISLSVTLSHECLETVGDPYANAWVRHSDGILYAQENCDPCEADSYVIDGVAVSNFVGPRWFSEGSGPYDYMGKLTSPFTMTSGGYMITMDANGDVHQVFGSSYPEWRKKTKEHAASRTNKRMHPSPHDAP